MGELKCNTHRIVAARALEVKKKTILITFEGKKLPRNVRYVFEVYKVAEYKPRPLVCFACHQIGHKADVCPRNIKRCGSCGQEHGEVEDCKTAPKCVNCDGAHVATSNECPKRQIPLKSNLRKKGQKTRSGPRGNVSSSQSQPVLTALSYPQMSASPGISWADTVRTHQDSTDAAFPLSYMASTANGSIQQRRPGHQSPSSQPKAFPLKDPLDWETRFTALSRRFEEGFAAVQTNTSRIERLESLAIEILTKVNYIGEKFDKYLAPSHER